MDPTVSSRIELVTPSAETPVSVAEAKTHLGITGAEYDTILTSLVDSATALAESFTGRTFVDATFRAWYDLGSASDLPIWEGVVQGARSELIASRFWIPSVPLSSVTEVKTYNDDGDATVFAATNYYVDAKDQNMLGRLILNYGASWPTDVRDRLSMSIEHVAGYGAAADVPNSIKMAVLQLVAYLFQNRGDCAGEAMEKSGASMLLRTHKFMGHL